MSKVLVTEPITFTLNDDGSMKISCNDNDLEINDNMWVATLPQSEARALLNFLMNIESMRVIYRE